MPNSYYFDSLDILQGRRGPVPRGCLFPPLGRLLRGEGLLVVSVDDEAVHCVPVFLLLFYGPRRGRRIVVVVGVHRLPAKLHVALGLRSLDLWPAIVAALGLPVELHRRGSLLLAHRVVDLLQHKAPTGHAPQRLDAAALRDLEPDVHGVAHAWLLPHEGQIHTVATTTWLTGASCCRCRLWALPAWTSRGRSKLRAAAPGHPDVLGALARVLLLDGEYAAAADLYRQVLAQRPDDPLTRTSFSATLLEMGDRAAGEANLRLALRGRPQMIGRTTAALVMSSHGRFFFRRSAFAEFLS